MSKPRYSISTAINVVYNLLKTKKFFSTKYLFIALVADGFDNTKANKIIEWAQLKLQNEPEQDGDSLSPVTM